jgi:hypothetical protein
MRLEVLVFAAVITHLWALSTPLANEENRDVSNIRKLLNVDEEIQNRRLFTAVQCPGGGPLNSFLLDIQIYPQGGFNTSNCTDAMVQNMTVGLNGLLYNYGVGPAGVGDNAVFLAEVCNRMLRRRRLVIKGFRWPGGGTCRQCTGDNTDYRRLQTNYDPNWFQNIYAPELQNKLRNAISRTFVQNFKPCLGTGPKVVVKVYSVADVQSITC